MCAVCEKTMQVLSDNSCSITAISIKFLGSDSGFFYIRFVLFFFSFLKPHFLEFIRIFLFRDRKESKSQKCSKFIEIETEKTQLVGKIIFIWGQKNCLCTCGNLTEIAENALAEISLKPRKMQKSL